MGKIEIKKVFLLSVLVLTIGLVTVLLRGPYVSDLLKKIILPELSAATGRQVSVRRISINIFPLFVEAREIKIPGDKGEIVSVPRIKGYIDISGFLRKELVLRRLVLKEPAIESDKAQLEDIAAKVKEYLAMERKAPVKVVVRALVMENGRFSLGYGDMSFRGRGFGVDAILNAGDTIAANKRAAPRIAFSVKELSSSVKGMPELKGDVKGSVIVKEDAIDVKSLHLGFYGSEIDVSGVFSEKEGLPSDGGARSDVTPSYRQSPPGTLGNVQVRLGLLMESFKKAFGLKQKGEGKIFAKGTITVARGDILRSVADIRMSGDLYVQTLLEALKVDEKIEGFVDFSGRLKGPLNELTGTAKAHLKKGNLYGIELDDLRCDVEYRGERLYFMDGKASLYHGTGEAEVTVSLSGDGYYALSARVADVDSPAVFTLIRWNPGIPLGKVKGELSTSGTAFNPSGAFFYESAVKGKDVVGRVKRIKGSFQLRDDVVSLAATEINTDKSTANVKGIVDIKESNLSLDIQAGTSDVTDLTLPYLQELKGSGEFSGTIKGKFDNPVISGKVKLRSASFEEYALGEIVGDVSYKRELLEVRDLSAAIPQPSTEAQRPEKAVTVAMRGTIGFPEAKELFDLKKPVYNLSVATKNADLERFAKIIYKKPLRQYPKGRFDATVTIMGEGPTPLYRGSARITDAHIGGFAVDSVSLSFSYDYRNFVIEDALVAKGDSTVTAKGGLSGDGKFSAKSMSGKVYFKDIPLKGSSPDAYMSFRGEGEGTWDMAGDKSHFTTNATINRLNVTSYGYSFSNDSDIRIEMKERKLTLSAARMRSGSASFTVSGDMEIGRSYNLVMEGGSELSVLKSFSKKIDVIRGDAAFVFSVAGKWDNPRIDGGVTLSNAAFGVKDVPYRISSINGYLYMDGERVVVQKLSGKMGGGDIDLSGVVLFQGFAMKRFYMDAAMSNVSVSVTKDFTVNFNGSVFYTGPADSPTLNGDIKINRAVYRERIDWQRWLFKAKERERPRGEMGILEKTNLNIRVQGTDNIIIDNNIARASLNADLILRGRLSDILILGRLDANTGIVYFRNNEFRILNASADFADPKRINPFMNINAETTIQGYTLRMALEGTLEHFDLSLSSIPSLEQIEIISLLTGGTISKEPKGIQGGIGVSTATSFLSGQVQGLARERLRSITGIDRIGVESAVSKVTGKSEQRLAVSKRLIGDKVSVTYTTALGSAATDVVRIEYDIGKNVTLIGERDEVGAFGGTIKFRFGFK